MKKILSVVLCLGLMLALYGCGSGSSSSDTGSSAPGTTEGTPDSSNTASATGSDTSSEGNKESETLPLPAESLELTFASGAGAWRSIITIKTDGSFTGYYLDSEAGTIGEGYPNGSAYTSTFSGKFTEIKKVNDYSYKMTLDEVQTEKAAGETWIEDGIRYIASGPHGLEESKTFMFYLPQTPVSSLSEELLEWWPYGFDEGAKKETLSCYGIENVTTQTGFFSEAK